MSLLDITELHQIIQRITVVLTPNPIHVRLHWLISGVANDICPRRVGSIQVGSLSDVGLVGLASISGSVIGEDYAIELVRVPGKSREVGHGVGICPVSWGTDDNGGGPGCC
jgi:hypothetical protein